MPADAPTLSVESAFALFAERFPSYEHRHQQFELACAIERAFRRGDTGVFEAGTGTGKSLAALIPAVLTGKRVVISTATISLQEQYIHKDIPALKSILPFEFEAAIMKGRGNYLGLRRYEDLLVEQEIDDRINDWARRTAYGDISELDFIPPLDVWLEINSDADDCLRNRCPKFRECFYFSARQLAQSADVLVVNHALLLADAVSEGNILPPYEYLVVDEAQHLPQIATTAFSSTISNKGLRFLSARASKKVSAPPNLVHDIEQEGAQLFHELSYRYPGGKVRIRQGIAEVNNLKSALGNLAAWLEAQEFENLLDVDLAREKAKLKAKALLTTTNNYLRCLDILEEPSDDWVVWMERSDPQAGKLELVAAPLDVSPFVQDLILDKPGLNSVVFMSATLASSGEDPFQFFKDQIGAQGHVIQARVDSPFDYKRQSLLYLPPHLPEPNHPDFIYCACDEIERIVRLTMGRAFVLFTSYSAMNAAYQHLKGRLSFECKRQGEMPRKKLVEWFSSTPSAVLFGTASFWEGVSIEGDQLSCVIIDRIPFQVPDDPVYEARCEAIKRDGDGDWFADLALPHAIMRLKQGVGRLIRTRSDRGLVAILDPRVTTKRYGRAIVDCLPPMTIMRNLNEITSLEDKLDSLANS